MLGNLFIQQSSCKKPRTHNQVFLVLVSLVALLACVTAMNNGFFPASFPWQVLFSCACTAELTAIWRECEDCGSFEYVDFNYLSIFLAQKLAWPACEPRKNLSICILHNLSKKNFLRQTWSYVQDSRFNFTVCLYQTGMRVTQSAARV